MPVVLIFCVGTIFYRHYMYCKGDANSWPEVVTEHLLGRQEQPTKAMV